MARLTDRIAAANADALDRLARAAPVLSGVKDARTLVPALSGRTLLHAGPPIAPAAMCSPMRGAVLGAALVEGWADTADEAARLLDSGAITLLCTHDHGAVGPMAGIISPTMPLFEVHDATTGRVACCPINEGIGAVLRFGAYDTTVLERLRWIRETLGPAIDAALQKLGGLPLIPLMARALAMGDEMHQRNIAATALFVRALAPHVVEAALPAATAAAVLRFLADNDQFFLSMAMAGAPAVAVFFGLRSAQDALVTTTRMSEITVGPNPHFKIPALDFAGTPTGIDIRRVVELETEPVINTGIAHRRAGVGQIGAGVARAPLACFQQALAAFAERYAT